MTQPESWSDEALRVAFQIDEMKRGGLVNTGTFDFLLKLFNKLIGYDEKEEKKQ